MPKKKKFNWEDKSVIGINKEKGHTLALPYDDINSILEGKQSPWKMSLNGKWKFNWSSCPMERPIDFYKTDFSVDNWDEINVPGLWQLQGYDTPYYLAAGYPPALSTLKFMIPKIDHKKNPVGSYRHIFNIPGNWESRETFIHFGAVKSAFYLYINGIEVGYSQGSMTPAEFNITEYIKTGENIIAVEVYRFCDGTYLEDQDMWFLSGIYRDVYLYSEPKTFIRDFYIHSRLDDDYTDARLTVDIEIVNHNNFDSAINIEGILVDIENENITFPIAAAKKTITKNSTEIIGKH